MKHGSVGDISVVVPTLNESKAIGRFLASMLAQTVIPKEILVVDGGSTDDTKRVVETFKKRFAVKHAAVRFIQLKKRGMTVARDKGFRMAISTYVASCDADTEYGKRYLEEALLWFRNHTKQGYVAVAGKPTAHTNPPWYVYINHASSTLTNAIFNVVTKSIVIIRGFNVIFLRAAYLSSTGMDVTIYAVEDEIGLSACLRQKGRIGYYPNFEVTTSDRAINKGFFHYFFSVIIGRYWWTYVVSKLTPWRPSYKRID